MKRIVFLDYVRVFACFLVMVVHASENFYGAAGSTERDVRRSRTFVSSGFSPVSRRACTFQRTRPTIRLTYFLLISLHLYPHEYSALVNFTF